MTTPTLTDAECDALIERTMQTANEREWVDRSLIRAGFAAGLARAVPREPNLAMERAGVNVLRVTGGDIYADACCMWQAMYDAALTERKKG